MTTKNLSSPSTSRQSWRELYNAALFETDKQTQPSRIDAAGRALLLRGRELFAISGDNNNHQEARAIDAALYALRALRNCLKQTIESEAACGLSAHTNQTRGKSK